MSSNAEPIPSRGADRRGQQRWNLAAPITVYLRGAQQPLGHAVNISLRGMLTVSEQPIALHQPLEIDLELPGDDGRWQRTPFVARAVRSFLDPDDDGIHNTGFQLDYVKPEALFSLQRLIHELETFG